MNRFLSLDHLEKTFGTLRVTADLSLEVSEGEILALLGPSGSGKTTVLRLVAGFETPDSGRVVVEEEDVTRTPPERRRFGMVFQHYALFPHMTVAENVAFGLDAQGMGKAEAAARVAETLAVVLDPTLRERTRRELARVIRRVGITTVFVTHEQEEAFDLADRVAVIHRGALQQVGSPEALYETPATRFVASFIGRSNALPATWDAAGNVAVLPTGQRWPAVPGDPVSGGEPVDLLVRPESLVFAEAGAAAAAGSVPGTVVARRYGGRASLFVVALDGLSEVEVSADSRTARPEERVAVAPSSEGPMPRVYSKERNSETPA